MVRSPKCTLDVQVFELSNCPQSVCGLNCTLTAHDVPTATGQHTHVLVCGKVSPVVVMLDTLSGASPIFVIVKTAGPDVVPTVVLPKLILETPIWRLPFPFFPVQVKGTVCVTVESLSVKIREAVRDPAAVGAQLTVAAQLAPGSTVLQLFVCVKLVAFTPDKATFEIRRLALPILFAVTTSAGDVEWLTV